MVIAGKRWYANLYPGGEEVKDPANPLPELKRVLGLFIHTLEEEPVKAAHIFIIRSPTGAALRTFSSAKPKIFKPENKSTMKQIGWGYSMVVRTDLLSSEHPLLFDGALIIEFKLRVIGDSISVPVASPTEAPGGLHSAMSKLLSCTAARHCSPLQFTIP